MESSVIRQRDSNVLPDDRILYSLKLILKEEKPTKSLVVFLLVTMLTAIPAFADIFKCVSEDGFVTFSDEPCGKNAEIAFQKYIMSVDDAVGLDLISLFTDRTQIRSIRLDLESHAKILGNCILPNEKRNYLFVDRAGGHHYHREIDWKLSLFFGPQGYEREWNINVFYKGKKEKNISVWLNSITVTKDGRPFNPPSMLNVKKLKKVGPGEWKVRAQQTKEPARMLE
jgi:hypothetical protein